MSVDIEAALRQGAARTLERNGLLLVGIVFVISALNALVGIGMARWATGGRFGPGMMPGGGGMMSGGPGAAGPILGVPPAFGGVLSFVLWLALVVVTIAAIRTFVTDETETIPEEHYRENLVSAGINFVIGGIVFAIVVGIGFVLLIVPGIFLLVTLAFWAVYVAVEDETFVDGFRDSWELTREHRLSLFLLGVAVLIVGIVVNGIFGGIGSVLGVAGVLVGQVGSAFTNVFSIATLAAAYNQLVALPSEAEEPVEPATSPDEGPAGAADG